MGHKINQMSRYNECRIVSMLLYTFYSLWTCWSLGYAQSIQPESINLIFLCRLSILRHCRLYCMRFSFGVFCKERFALASLITKREKKSHWHHWIDIKNKNLLFLCLWENNMYDLPCLSYFWSVRITDLNETEYIWTSKIHTYKIFMKNISKKMKLRKFFVRDRTKTFYLCTYKPPAKFQFKNCRVLFT
jgi:hypothetical protein